MQRLYSHSRKLEQFIPQQHVWLDGRLCIEDLITADFTEVPQRTVNKVHTYNYWDKMVSLNKYKHSDINEVFYTTCITGEISQILLDVPSPTLHQTSATACLQTFCCAIVNLVLNDIKKHFFLTPAFIPPD